MKTGTGESTPEANREINFDGLVGPTHNYAGLAQGNLASTRNRSSQSNPREAALQGLEKMKWLSDRGLRQAVLPPQERPHLPTLRKLGFSGNDADILARAAREEPEVLAACGSASNMWTANAATVSPSADTADGRVHFTVANLSSQFHRFLESDQTALVLRRIFPPDAGFVHHAPLPAGRFFTDEGAANHMRLCDSHGSSGLEIFVYGRCGLAPEKNQPHAFPARQSLEASRAMARLHGLEPARTLFLRQSPAAIDSGIFHNDVIAVSNENVLFFHESAYENGPGALEELRRRFHTVSGLDLAVLEVPESRLSIREAVDTYLFNSQLITLPAGEITLPQGGMCLLAAEECRENIHTRSLLEEILEDPGNPIHKVEFRDLRQSMRNGGGPACLRLRVVLTGEEMLRVHSGVFLTEELYAGLRVWIEKNYRDRILPEDLADSSLLNESRRALDELTQILRLGSLYDFQLQP